MKQIKYIIPFLIVILTAASSKAQVHPEEVIIDQKGIMRSKKGKAEIKGFGINYTVPFAHAWRSARKMGIDPKAAMRDDVYHFTRLGFDLYRVHVWDTEISDSLGNLINNEHLDAFDYLLWLLKDKGFNAIITPIAFWGNGWPEPDESTGSFSMKYGKKEALTNADAIEAQHNYLKQFLNHVNPYTGLAYKDEPMILAFEVSNEPHHTGDAAVVTEFVKGMVGAFKETGTKKPVFYNISHAVHFADAYFQGGIQGGTFQWYPTGLGYKKELSGNLLPNVDNYHIPFDSVIRKYHGAKIVYEFDAADVNKSYIYPAMARSFRGAGIQLATHFAYDPTFLAPHNTEYNTHYMNLVYTPKKALALMIAARIFHEIPMYSDFGKFPHDTVFQNITISYKNDLAVYNSPESFIYTNHTKIKPKTPEQLQQIAGYGNSEIITFGGSGAYFMDKISEGIWRLEVMPDAVAIDDPFGRNSLDKIVSQVQWNFHPMQVNLPNLGRNFTIKGINEGNTIDSKTTNGFFNIGPGTYLLMRSDAFFLSDISGNWGKVKLNDFVAPKSEITQAWFSHTAPSEVEAGTELSLFFNYIAPARPIKTELVAWLQSDYRTIPMKYLSPGKYQAIIPADMMKHGILHYWVVVTSQDRKTTTWPGQIKGHPWDWDFTGNNAFQTRIVPTTFPITLFDACSDAGSVVGEWKPGLKLLPATDPQKCMYVIELHELFTPDIENLQGDTIYDYSFRHSIEPYTRKRLALAQDKQKLIIQAASLLPKKSKLQVALVMDNGAAFGKVIELKEDQSEITLQLDELHAVTTVLLPRPYPTFLPYFFDHENKQPFDLRRVESLQFSIGAAMPGTEQNAPQKIGILQVKLE